MPATWRNWGRSVASHPDRIISPEDEQQVVDLVMEAGRYRQTIRPVGAGHSFSPVAATDSILLRLDRLTGLIAVDSSTGEATIGAGTRLADIPGLLRPHGLAMENLGDIDRQTIAGAISTGTHGTGARFTGLAGQVTGLRIVLADGTVADIDPEHQPELFDAARLGLGAFGILTRVRLRCVPDFLLAADEHPEPLEPLLDDFPHRAAAVDHLEFYLFPHTDTAVVKENTRLPRTAVISPRSRWRRFTDDVVTQNVLFGAMCAVGATIPATIPPMNRLAALAMSRTTYTDASTEVLTTARQVRFREMEYGIDLPALPSAVRQVRALIADRGWRISFPMEIRVAAADTIPLSTAFRRPTAYIAVHRYVSEPFAQYFLAVERILLAHGGRPHWGKLHTQQAAALRRRYPLFDEVAALRRAVDPAGLFRNGHLDRIFGDDRVH